MTPNLYSYCIPYDDGAAPNPFWGVCTLVICKPDIRRTARVGDWVVGTGSKHARLGDGSTRDLSGQVVYAMKVTQKMTMSAYDAHTKVALPKKIPVWGSRTLRLRLGDSIYDFSHQPATQREGVHNHKNEVTDLKGKYALLSTHFYYFGDQAIPLPQNLKAIAQNQQGHRRQLNAQYAEKFIDWIDSRGHEPGALVGNPLLDLSKSKSACGWCAGGRAEGDAQDVEDLRGVC